MTTHHRLIYATVLLTASFTPLALSQTDKKSDKTSEDARASGPVIKSKSNLTNNKEASGGDSKGSTKQSTQKDIAVKSEGNGVKDSKIGTKNGSGAKAKTVGVPALDAASKDAAK